MNQSASSSDLVESTSSGRRAAIGGAAGEAGQRGTGQRELVLPGDPSLALLFREYGERWEIEKVQRSTEWVAVLRETGGDYIRVVGAHDLGALRYKMDQVERDAPEERENPGAR